LAHFLRGEIMKYSYQVQYRHPATRTAGAMILPSAAKAEEGKRRLERIGYVVTAILLPVESEPEIRALPINQPKDG
jgi:hypothetical protein